jgi:hypothetical protein
VLSDTELAYAAGIFDGEGCLSLAHRGKRGSGYITPSLQVGNTNEPLLRWLQECFGGGVYHNKESRPTHRETWSPMPFRSRAQQRFMYSQHPEIARRWEDKYGISKNLPDRLTNKRRRRRRKRRHS